MIIYVVVNKWKSDLTTPGKEVRTTYLQSFECSLVWNLRDQIVVLAVINSTNFEKGIFQHEL